MICLPEITAGRHQAITALVVSGVFKVSPVPVWHARALLLFSDSANTAIGSFVDAEAAAPALLAFCFQQAVDTEAVVSALALLASLSLQAVDLDAQAAASALLALQLLSAVHADAAALPVLALCNIQQVPSLPAVTV